MEILRISHFDVNVMFVGKGYIKNLNLRYRRRNVVTDILAFPYFEVSGKNLSPLPTVLWSWRILSLNVEHKWLSNESFPFFICISTPPLPAPSPPPPPDGGNPLASHTFFSKETEFWISQVKTLKLPAYNRRLGCLNLSSIESGGWIKIGCPIIGHVRYFKIQAWLRGFWVKIANLSSFLCPSIPKRDLDTKKTTPNIEVWPESLGAMLCTYQRGWPRGHMGE